MEMKVAGKMHCDFQDGMHSIINDFEASETFCLWRYNVN